MTIEDVKTGVRFCSDKSIVIYEVKRISLVSVFYTKDGEDYIWRESKNTFIKKFNNYGYRTL